MNRWLLAAVCGLAIALGFVGWRVHVLEERLLDLAVKAGFTASNLEGLRGLVYSTRVYVGLPQDDTSESERAKLSQRNLEDRARANGVPIPSPKEQ